MSEIRLELLPVDEVPAFAMPIVAAIGLAAINWGKLGLHMDALLRHLNNDDFVTGALDRFPETSFRLKCQAFAKWYARHPALSCTHEIARPMVFGLKKANLSRVRLFHSSVQGFSEGPPATIDVVILKFDEKADTITHMKGSWTLEAIRLFNDLVCQLNLDCARISQIVMNEPFRQSLRKS